MPAKKRKKIKLVMTVINIALIGYFVVQCNQKIKNEIENQMKTVVEDTAELNNSVLKNEIESKYRFLEGLVTQITVDHEKSQEVIENVKPMIDVYDFKRIGYVDALGNAITTDDFEGNISKSEVYIESMKGKPYIGANLEETIGDNTNHINVISTPIINEQNEITGAFFLTYDVNTANQMLYSNMFEGRGYAYVIDEEGIVASCSDTDNPYIEHNFFEVAKSLEQNDTDMSHAKEDILNHKSGGLALELEEKKWFYYAPLDLLNEKVRWYLITVVPEDLFDDHLAVIMNYVAFLVVLILTVCSVYVIYSFIEDRKQEKHLFELAYVDPFTKGYNISYLLHYLKSHYIHKGFIVSLDLDNFKLINSVHGYAMGDAIILSIQEVIQPLLKHDELIAHENADTFMMYLELDDIEARIAQFQKSIEQLSMKYAAHIYPKFGIYLIDQVIDGKECFEYANIAKKTIKGNHKKAYAFYDHKLQQQMLLEIELEEHFLYALEHHEFEVWYQPKYNPNTNEAIGGEGLVRWRYHDRVVMPGQFIPLLEKNGYIAQLDTYVFEEVCKYQKEMLERGEKIIPISVNVSRASLSSYTIIDRYEDIIENYHLDPTLIELEVTESAMGNDDQIIFILNQFRNYGFKILIDDFGTGLSSLSVVNLKCINTLKLDRSLIVNLQEGKILLKYLMNLAHDMGLHVTVEGVENEQQVEYLKEIGCSDIQGYFYSKPLPEKEFNSLVYKPLKVA